MQTIAFLGPLGGWEILVIGLVGLLIFGKRLPDVGRGIGRGILEFKKGLQGIEDDMSIPSAMADRPAVDGEKPRGPLTAPAQRAQPRLAGRQTAAPRPGRP